MKIIIIGAGRIGTNLSQSLADEDHEVYLIEHDLKAASRAEEKLDVKVLRGNGADPDVLRRAQVAEASLVLAVTTSDETNLVVCSLASLLGARRRIARVRGAALNEILNEFGYHHFHINEIINPEEVAAREIVKTIEAPGTKEVAEFSGGRILLRAFDVPEGSPLCNQTMEELRDEDFPWPFLIVSVIRKTDVLIPRGDAMVKAGDRIYVLLPQYSLGEFLTFVDPGVRLPKKVIIYGASITGRHVAKGILNRVKDIIVLEEDLRRAKEISQQLGEARVIHGSGAEADTLIECGVETAEVFIAVTDNDHSNFISAVLAKKMGAKRTIIETQEPEYMSLMKALDIDAIINPHYIAVEQILRLVRGRGIRAVTKLPECDAEALEFIPEPGAPVTREAVRNIRFPKKAIIGAVDDGERVSLVNGDTRIQAGQKVIVFCQDSAVKKLQRLFTC